MPVRDTYLPPTTTRIVLQATLASIGLWLSASSGWAIPPYDPPHLQARSNFNGAYQMPDGAFFTNSTVQINASGQTAIKIGVVVGSDSQAVWQGRNGAGGLIYTGPAGAFIGDVGLESSGRVVFQQVFSAPDGIYFRDPNLGTDGLLTNQPLGTSTWGSPKANQAGQVGYRAGFGNGQAWVSYDGLETRIHAAEAGIDATSPYSFLFTPSFDDQRRIAGKVRLGAAGQFGESQPDRVLRFTADGVSTLIAEDVDSNPAAPYSGFDNSVANAGDAGVAFIASLVAGGRGVFLADGTTSTEIAREGLGGVGQIEFFAPAANAAGLVAFRAVDQAGLQAIFVGDGEQLVRVVGEHDLVETDLGTGRLDQHDSSPIFGGGVAINGLGELAFAAGLTPPDNDQIEWGSGIFVVTTGGIFADGFESGDLTRWSSSLP